MKRVDDFRPAPMPDLLSPAVRSADAAERTAQVIAEMHAATEAMVLLNQQTLKTAEQSLAASESARLDAARSEKFAKAMSWASVVIAGASLAAAVVAIAVSVSGS
jgi:CHASE3 domain sensor protein